MKKASLTGKRFAFLLIIVLAFILSLAIPLPLNAQNSVFVRAPVWVYLEDIPGFTETQAQKPPPKEELEGIARWLMGGMIYGWKYSYSPPDALRNVKEFFSLDPLAEIPESDPRFSLTDLRAEYPRLTSWAQYETGDVADRWRRYWSSTLIDMAKGRGSAEITDGSAGIKAAYANALMQAVRERARITEKNKPKEVTGDILIRDTPRLFADQGRFVAELEVYISLGEIIPWKTF